VGGSQAPGVVLAVGARRNGWLLAPLVAQMAAACVLGGDLGPYARRFDPLRFKAGRGSA
jgi:glycine oxidase